MGEREHTKANNKLGEVGEEQRKTGRRREELEGRNELLPSSGFMDFIIVGWSWSVTPGLH